MLRRPLAAPLFDVAEFMVGGSVYDYLHKHRGSMKLPMVLRVACDVAKGMDFLHKNNIIHRDLKTANLLMDENDVSLLEPAQTCSPRLGQYVVMANGITTVTVYRRCATCRWSRLRILEWLE